MHLFKISTDSINSLKVYKKLQFKIYFLVLIICFPLDFIVLQQGRNNYTEILLGALLSGILFKLYYITAINILVYNFFKSDQIEEASGLGKILKGLGKKWINMIKTVGISILDDFKILPLIYPTVALKEKYSYEAIEYAESISTKVKKLNPLLSIVIALSYYFLFIINGVFIIYFSFSVALILSILSDLFLGLITIYVTILFLNFDINRKISIN